MLTQVHGANQEDARSTITSFSMGSFQTSFTLRRARVAKPEEKMADELLKQVINEMEKQIQEKEDEEPRDKNKAISIVRKVFEEAEQTLDFRFLSRSPRIKSGRSHTRFTNTYRRISQILCQPSSKWNDGRSQ